MAMGRCFVRSHRSESSASRAAFLSSFWPPPLPSCALERVLHRRARLAHEVVVVAARDAVHLHLHLAHHVLALGRDGGRHRGEALRAERVALVEHVLRRVAHRQAVHEHDAALHGLAALHSPARQLQALAVLADEHVVGRDAGRLGQLGVGAQVRGLAVHGHERLRLHDGQHELQLLGAGVAGDVHHARASCRRRRRRSWPAS